MAGKEAIEGNLYGLYEAVSATGLVESGNAGDFNFIRHRQSVWPNMCYPGPSGLPPNIGKLVKAMKEEGCPRLVVMGEDMAAPGVIAQMNGNRFVCAAEWVNMELCIRDDTSGKDAGNQGKSPGTSTGPEESPELICRVIDAGKPGDWKEWSSIAEATLFKNKALAPEIFRGGQEKGIFQLIAGYSEGRAVSTSLLYFGSLAGVYMVATSEGSQGRGFAKKLMKYTASLAAHRGYSSLVLHSTGQGLRLYTALGFEKRGKLLLYFCMS